MPLLLLSGRTGRRLWIAGPLPLRLRGARLFDDSSGPSRGSSSRAPRPTSWCGTIARSSRRARPSARQLVPAGSPGADLRPHRRDHLGHPRGRASIAPLWSSHVPSTGIPRPRWRWPAGSHPGLADGLADRGQPGAELKVVSPRDGRLLWSQSLEPAPLISTFTSSNRTRESGGTWSRYSVEALSQISRPGLRRPRRQGALDLAWPGFRGASDHGFWMATARLDAAAGTGSASSTANLEQQLRIVVLDDHGREIKRRDIPANESLPSKDIHGLLPDRRPRRRRPRGIPCLALRPSARLGTATGRALVLAGPSRRSRADLPALGRRCGHSDVAIGAGPRWHDGPAAMGGPAPNRLADSQPTSSSTPAIGTVCP